MLLYAEAANSCGCFCACISDFKNIPTKRMGWLQAHNETPSFINVQLEVCDIPGTSTKKIIRKTGLENLKLVGELSARDREKNEEGCSFKRIATLDLTILKRRNFVTGVHLSHASVQKW